MSAQLITTLHRELAERLPRKRHTHVMGVEGMTLLLADQWGIDPEACHLAALLHDYAKAQPARELETLLAKSQRFALSEEDRQHPAIWHGLAAAEIAATRFALTDDRIREAVAWHPTGAAPWSDVGLVLYVADYLEPGRNFTGVDQQRAQFSALSLREAALAIAKEKIRIVQQRGQVVHSRTTAMVQWLQPHFA